MTDTLEPDEFGTEALIRLWQRQGHQIVAAAVGSAHGVALAAGVSESIKIFEPVDADLTLTGQVPAVLVSAPELLIGALVETGDRTIEGDIVIALTPVYHRLFRELEKDPNALYRLDPRQFEELIAGAYQEAKFDSVVLTPRSGDRGRDVIATSKYFGTVRILDQVKLYAPHREVKADDVRALYGVLAGDLGASKGVVTTTSRFAPGIYEEFKDRMPGRITLRDGAQLRKWLLSPGHARSTE